MIVLDVQIVSLSNPGSAVTKMDKLPSRILFDKLASLEVPSQMLSEETDLQTRWKQHLPNPGP